jgi:photosystem II stability/assembly factor-like uncharacterized protein
MKHAFSIAAIGLLASVVASSATCAEPFRKLPDAERIIAAKNAGYFPVMIKLKDGALVAVIRAGATHLGRGGRLDILRSTDGGRTWSKPITAIDSPWDDRNPALGQMSDGTLVLAYAEVRCYNDKGEFVWKPNTYFPYTVTSSDGGLTWSEKKPFQGPWSDVSPYGKILVCKDGTALMSIYRFPSEGVGILRSKDQGKTWGDYTQVPGKDETQIIELADGRLMIVGRLEGDNQHGLIVSESDDQGRTWVRTRKLMKPNQWPFDATMLQSGNLLLSFGSRITGLGSRAGGPFGAGVVLSKNQGKTWDFEHQTLIGWDSHSGDTGYPSTVQLGDGTIVTMYYAVGAGTSPDIQAIVIRYTEKQLENAMAK